MSDTGSASYRSFAEQALHYFVRRHKQAPSGPLASPADWRGAEMRDRVETWMVILSDEHILELSMAADEFIASAILMGELSEENFRLPELAREIDLWRDQIAGGLGFVVIRGLPFREWGEEKSSIVFWGLGHYLGFPARRMRAGSSSAMYATTATRESQSCASMADAGHDRRPGFQISFPQGPALHPEMRAVSERNSPMGSSSA